MQIEGWTLSSLGEIGKWSGGGTPSKAKKEFWENGNIPWVSPKDMWQKKISTTEDYITQSAVENSATKIYPKDSILVVTRSGILRKKLPVALAKIPVAVNQDIKVLTPNEKFSSEYLFNFMWCYNDSLLANCAKDGTTVESIDTTALLTYPINLPPLAEQKKIAEILSTWDKAIETVEKLVANSQQQKKALMQQLLTGQKRLLDDNGVKFGDEWEIGNLGKLCSLKGGSAFKESFQGETVGEIPFIKVSDMNLIGNEKNIINANNWISEETAKTMKSTIFPKNVIVFAKVGAALLLNRRRILVRPTIIDNNMMAAIPNKNVNLDFLFHLLSSIDFARFVQEGAIPSVNQSDLASFKVKFPIEKEQEKIAQVLTLADREIDLYQQQLDKLKLEKKSLMQQLLTGQKRVKLGGEY